MPNYKTIPDALKEKMEFKLLAKGKSKSTTYLASYQSQFSL